MKREIKFRAWCKQHDGSWYMFTPEELRQSDFRGLPYLTACLDFDDAFVMQYTGLKDRNGKEIYEGDIVSFSYFYGSVGDGLGFVECDAEIKGVVTWFAFGWGLSAIAGEHWQGYTGYDAGEGHSSFVGLCEFSESSLEEDSFEVIGNIHENPNMLEAEESA